MHLNISRSLTEHYRCLAPKTKQKKQSSTYAAHKNRKVTYNGRKKVDNSQQWRKEFPIILIMGFAYFDWDLQTLDLDFITNWRKCHHTPFHISYGIFNVLLLYHTKPNFLYLQALGLYFKLNFMDSLLINRAARSFRKAEMVLGHTVQPKVMWFNFTIFWRNIKDRKSVV